MVYRIYVEKRPCFTGEADELTAQLNAEGIDAGKVRILLRYDVEGVTAEQFSDCRTGVFADPRTDVSLEHLPDDGSHAFAVEYLPGQFDDRAEAAQQCIRLITMGAAAKVRTAKVYLIYGELKEEEMARIKSRIINPVDSREATLEEYESLAADYDEPDGIDIIEGFTDLDDSGLEALIKSMGLAMDAADAACCREYFIKEGRQPTVTELTVLDTYWSDHCRHTTFNTRIDGIAFEDENAAKAYERYLALREDVGAKKPVCLMDMATIGAKYLKKQGVLTALDESEEINACTVKIVVDNNGNTEPWLLLFKNETHNHPTEIEPYGGAATCVGGAIRDPLSGRGYVYQSMRVTGAADPRAKGTLPGKLPQKRIVREAAEGFSSYGNRIGLATGEVKEYYHAGYAAKRMEVGAVIAAAPAKNVVRERPAPGDAVLLIGGKTGRDGCGGATGASKAHTASSIETCGAEVQKGNAPEERKLQRLFRNAEASKMIKRCNDFGAGGVSVAIGELADGLDVYLDRVPKKYMGLTATELAVSESQERMAVVVSNENAERMISLAAAEGLTAVHVADVKADPRLTLYYKGQKAVDLSREFIDSNGAPKHINVTVERGGTLYDVPMLTPDASPYASGKSYDAVKINNSFNKLSFADKLAALMGDLNRCSQRGLTDMFDSTVGANTVLFPFGGAKVLTPAQAMAAKLPVASGSTNTCSLMSHGFDPYISEASPYIGAYSSVVSSVLKLIAAGSDRDKIWLSFQEYFERPGQDPKAWGKPAAALLGALDAQIDLSCAAIGGKDSMSGSFENIHVPPTLISFAAGVGEISHIVSPEFKQAGHKAALLRAKRIENSLPEPSSLNALLSFVESGIKAGEILSCHVPGRGGAAESLLLMSLGNNIGIQLACDENELFNVECGSVVVELAGSIPGSCEFEVIELGETLNDVITFGNGEQMSIADIMSPYFEGLTSVFPTEAESDANCGPEIIKPEKQLVNKHIGIILHTPPMAVIPVFPGTNCEYETERAFRGAGFGTAVTVIRTGSEAALAASIDEFRKAVEAAEVLFIPGGFSNSDEPDGSGKFIASFLRNDDCRRAVEGLLAREGLIGGICNGFQALVRTGLLPYGRFTEPSADMPVLAPNTIGRHQSQIVKVRVEQNVSPWLSMCRAGEVYRVPISHGEGRFAADEALLAELAASGQIITRYVDDDGQPSMSCKYNPNGSKWAVEGVCSPDGRIFGKMGHAERIGSGLYKNVPGRYDMRLFEAARRYFE